MKKSARVTLTVVAVVGMAACSRQRRDPCDAASFSEQACQDAIRNGGYYWNGSWMPMAYHYPFPYYYDSYRRHIGSGGAVHAAPAGSYSRPSSSGVVRGGFGSTGGGHVVGG